MAESSAGPCSQPALHLKRATVKSTAQHTTRGAALANFMFETAKATDQHRVLSGGLLHSKETTSSPTEQLLYTVCVYAYIGAESLRLKVELRGGRIGQLRCEAEVGKLHTSSQEEHCGRRRRCRSKAWSVKTIHVKQIQWTEKWLFS